MKRIEEAITVFPILLVEDDAHLAATVAEFLQDKGFMVYRAGTCARAREILEHQSVHVALVDRKLPDGEGTLVANFINTRGLKTKMILVTAYGMDQNVSESLKKGAFDFLQKPFDLETLLKRVCNAGRLYQLEFSSRVQHGFQKSAYRIVGKSPEIRRIRHVIHHVAPMDTWVLITGETGTGKELIARNIHLDSNRSHQQFISVNCASIPETLFESEFFGYRRGAFTGAVRDKPGYFEMAASGTLHLDEIGEMPLEFQAKLLRVLEEGTFIKLGGGDESRVDVRLIASTNKNLQHEVERGRFRRDLFFRIAVFMIHVPPLRERPEDIPLIAAHLWSGLNQRMGMKETALPVADEDLVNQPWTGNVRELRNFLERQLLYLRMGRPTGFDPVTGLENRTAAEPDARMVTLEEHSRNYVLDVLQRLNYNKAQTARVLGIGLSTLKRWLNQWGVRVERRLDNQESG